MHHKMMRWYQIVEQWCVERDQRAVDPKKADRLRREIEAYSQFPGDANVGEEMRFMQNRERIERWGPLVPDNERAIVAPPPRPPLFIEENLMGLAMNAGRFPSTLREPYGFDRWVDACRQWWTKTSIHFERLRVDPDIAGMHHVSKQKCAPLHWETVLELVET
jgi:hypothetical protein